MNIYIYNYENNPYKTPHLTIHMRNVDELKKEEETRKREKKEKNEQAMKEKERVRIEEQRKIHENGQEMLLSPEDLLLFDEL